MTFREMRRRLRIDKDRLRECVAARGLQTRWISLSPSWVCVLLYRCSRLCFARGWRIAARIIWHGNLFLTGADLSPASDLGEGLVVVHPCAVTISGHAGRDLSIEGWGGLGGGLSMENIGAGPGLPILGDGVRMDRGAMVLGPVRVGNGVRIGPGCTVVRDLPDSVEVLPQPVRLRS